MVYYITNIIFHNHLHLQGAQQKLPTFKLKKTLQIMGQKAQFRYF